MKGDEGVNGFKYAADFLLFRFIWHHCFNFDKVTYSKSWLCRLP